MGTQEVSTQAALVRIPYNFYMSPGSLCAPPASFSNRTWNSNKKSTLAVDQLRRVRCTSSTL
ncbi:uncharacterized protein METZ01_LOCUS14045 [marine metagenome]|uniref:Uncharacterized protein n=1 Tax=marine metagenome TaxID=408172 RepID=A0A381P2Q3_9ZZZZ